MFQSFSNASSAYAKVGIDIGAEVASPHKLIVMLYDGAVLALTTAKARIDTGDQEGMSEYIRRGCNIIDQGLRDSLDLQAGGELAVRLQALYNYMAMRLQLANIKSDPQIIEEVLGLLQELRSAWGEIATDPAVVSTNKAAA